MKVIAHCTRMQIKRAVLLFVLGMIAQGNLLQFNMSTFHPFYSVLHGIAAGYLIATIVTLNFKVKGTGDHDSDFSAELLDSVTDDSGAGRR